MASSWRTEDATLTCSDCRPRATRWNSGQGLPPRPSTWAPRLLYLATGERRRPRSRVTRLLSQSMRCSDATSRGVDATRDVPAIVLFAIGLAIACGAAWRGATRARRAAEDPLRALEIMQGFRIAILG